VVLLRALPRAAVVIVEGRPAQAEREPGGRRARQAGHREAQRDGGVAAEHADLSEVDVIGEPDEMTVPRVRARGRSASVPRRLVIMTFHKARRTRITPAKSLRLTRELNEFTQAELARRSHISEPEKGEGGMLLGLLVGRHLPRPADALLMTLDDEPPGRHVFTLQWSAAENRWRPYGDGLVSWMKERLAPPALKAEVDAVAHSPA